MAIPSSRLSFSRTAWWSRGYLAGSHPPGCLRRTTRVEMYMDLIPAYFQAFTALLVFFPPLRRDFGGVGPWSHFKTVAPRFEQLLAEEIAARRQAPQLQDDILSLLLAARHEDGSPMTDQELRDELKTLLIEAFHPKVRLQLLVIVHIRLCPYVGNLCHAQSLTAHTFELRAGSQVQS
jgi:hypothetical protein